MHGEMLIDGHFIGGPCDQAVGKAVQRSPWDHKIVGTAAEGSFLELRAAIEAADCAYPLWSKTSTAERKQLLLAIADRVEANRHELADLLVDEIGKPVTLALGEVSRMRTTFLIAAHALDSWQAQVVDLGPDPRADKYRCTVERLPRGVVFGIAPFNWPYNLAAHKIAPALATGNTVVLKPSPTALLSTYALARLIHEAGCPPGVLNIVEAPPRDVALALQDPRIRLVSFTGSEKVGWEIKSKLPPETHCVLELGGNASNIVLADADLSLAVDKLVFGGFAYAGQICISVQNIWIEDVRYEEFANNFNQAAANCPYGDPHLSQTVCGPLISEAAADRVQGFIGEAVQLGGKILTGGHREGCLLQPTVLENVPLESPIVSEEAFGPVVVLHRFSSLPEVIHTINQGRFGIQAGLFTEDTCAIQKVFCDLSVGGVVINDSSTTRFDAFPYGGEKRSGFGREGVYEAMASYTEPRTLLISGKYSQ
jgi:acyl-CoA reductase-like NAD-dependent aldehyde dehydrogenase